MHSIWLALLVPPMLFVLLAFQQARRKSIWWICWAMSALLMLGVVIATIATMGATGPMLGNLFQKILFSVLKATDFPFFAFFVASSVNLVLVQFLKRSVQSSKEKTISAE